MQAQQENLPAQPPEKKPGKRKAVRIIAFLLVIVPLALLFLPWRENPYYIPKEPSASTHGADDEKEPDEETVRNMLRRGAWRYGNEEYENLMRGEAFTTEELLRLFDLPFTTEEYISFIKKEHAYEQKARISLMTSYFQNRNANALGTLQRPYVQHYLIGFPRSGSDVPDSTYLRMNTVSHATGNLLKLILCLVLAAFFGALLLLFRTFFDTESRRKRFFLVAIPLYAVLAIGMYVAYQRAQTLVPMKMIREGGVAYLFYNDSLRVAGIRNSDEIGEELVIPDTVQGYPVISVLSFSGPYDGRNTFIHSSRGVEPRILERIVLPDSVKVLWSDALTRYNGDYPRTKQLELGNGVLRIATDAREQFRQEQELLTDDASLLVPASVRQIDEGAFYGSALEEVVIAKEAPLTVLPEECFSGCNRLKNLELPGALTTIGEEAFYGCTSLEQINLPVSLQTIEYRAFSNCTSLVSVEGLDFERISIGTDAFYRTPFSENPENFGGPYPVISKNGSMGNVYGAGKTVDLPDTVKDINIYRLPEYVETVVIPEKNDLSTISYSNPVTRDYKNPLVLKFEGDSAKTLLEREAYYGPYSRHIKERNSAGLLPTGFLILEVPEGSAMEGYAREAGVPYRIAGADDEVSEDGYLVSYRFRRSFEALSSYHDTHGFFHVELTGEERSELTEDEPGGYRYKLSVDYEFEGITRQVGSFVIDDLPDGFDRVPLSTIGFGFSEYERAWYMSVYCGTRELKKESSSGEPDEPEKTETEDLFRRFHMDKPGGGDSGISAVLERGEFSEDGYYAAYAGRKELPQHLDESDRYDPDGE